MDKKDLLIAAGVAAFVGLVHWLVHLYLGLVLEIEPHYAIPISGAVVAITVFTIVLIMRKMK